MKKYLILFGILIGVTTYAQPLPETAETKEEKEKIEKKEATPESIQQTFESSIVSAFKSGKAEKIAAYFGKNVNLSILESENLYSKSQAQQVLKGFFAENEPKDFSVLHKGKSGQSQYFIGELTASSGTYRVTINSKPSGSKNTITSLTIEEG